jgi:hypothetical protein
MTVIVDEEREATPGSIELGAHETRSKSACSPRPHKPSLPDRCEEE